MQRKSLILALLAVLTLGGAAQASLIDRGSGLVYDTALNITWLAAPSGPMDWPAANTWAENLNYGGYTDWRLPATLQPDSTCGTQSGGVSYGINCTGSEMGHLFYKDLGGTVGTPILSSGAPGLALFPNLVSGIYWSGTKYVPPVGAGDYAWIFYMNNGYLQSGSLGADTTNGEYYVLAVRPGDVAPPSNVPEPATLTLVGLGMGWLGWARRRR